MIEKRPSKEPSLRHGGSTQEGELFDSKSPVLLLNSIDYDGKCCISSPPRVKKTQANERKVSQHW